MITHSTRQFIRFFIDMTLDFYRSKNKSRALIPIALVTAGMFVPQEMIIPVASASTRDWDEQSFWAYPWGKSVTHKGIDIFAPKGTPVVASTYGLVVYTGENAMGGNSLIVMGPKWRFHYYAHLETIDVFTLKPVKIGAKLGTVGNTGNAVGKPYHLHYTISTPLPYFWLSDDSVQGWKKMFYLNPDAYLR